MRPGRPYATVSRCSRGRCYTRHWRTLEDVALTVARSFDRFGTTAYTVVHAGQQHEIRRPAILPWTKEECLEDVRKQLSRAGLQ